MPAEGIIRSYVNRGRGGTFYLALRDFTNKPEVIAEFRRLGYRSFRGAYTKQIINDNIEQTYTELKNIEKSFGVEVDFSALDDIKTQLTPLPSEPASGQLTDFIQKLKAEIAQTPASDQAKMLSEMIEKHLEELATSVDEAAKQEFLKEFFDFASKFWNYSASNLLLIFFQTAGKASYVRGKKQWEGLGRRVRPGEPSILILAPVVASKRQIAARDVEYVLRFVQQYNVQ
jgi:hypothetical protein